MYFLTRPLIAKAWNCRDLCDNNIFFKVPIQSVCMYNTDAISDPFENQRLCSQKIRIVTPKLLSYLSIPKAKYCEKAFKFGEFVAFNLFFDIIINF